MFRPIKSFTDLIIILILFTSVYAYKQFQLTRTALDYKLAPSCSTTQKAGSTFQEICYYKDVSYHTQILIDQNVYYVSMDLTAPHSWLKSPNCKNTNNQNCQIIQSSQKIQAKKFFKDINTKYTLLSRHHENSQQKLVEITGSSDKIVGIVQQISYGQIYGRDSRKSKSFLNLIGVSLFVTSVKDRIILRNVELINAKKISTELNKRIDGSISLKANKNQSNTFLQQLFVNSQSSQRFISIFIHPLSKSGVLSIGDLSFKNCKSRPSEITWIQMKNSLRYGLFNRAYGMSLNSNSSSQIVLNFTKNVFYTISSSFIYLPTDILDWLKKCLEEQTKAHCQITVESSIFVCKWRNLQDKKKVLYMKMLFKLSSKQTIQIPLTTLIRTSDSLHMQFTIKKSLLADQILLGEPLFQEYLVYLDYKSQKIGFAQPLFHQADKYANILVYFLRFILFATIILFLFYICWRPCSKLKNFFQRRLVKRHKQNGLYKVSYEQQNFLS